MPFTEPFREIFPSHLFLPGVSHPREAYPLVLNSLRGVIRHKVLRDTDIPGSA